MLLPPAIGNLKGIGIGEQVSVPAANTELWDASAHTLWASRDLLPAASLQPMPYTALVWALLTSGVGNKQNDACFFRPEHGI